MWTSFSVSASGLDWSVARKFAGEPLLLGQLTGMHWTLIYAAIAGALALFAVWLSVRHIPNNMVGIVEKLWSATGSVGEGSIIALNGEAGFQAELLRGGLHFGYWRWQYRVHKTSLVTIAQGKIGYVYARDGESLPSSQTLARIVDCCNFEDARGFLRNEPTEGKARHRGQRGRQRAILREGVYAINLAAFVVIAEDRIFALRAIQDRQEAITVGHWREELLGIDGFSPIVVGRVMEASDPLNPEHTIEVDSIGIATVHDGPSLEPGEIIAPACGTNPSEQHYHNNYQDPEAFLHAGGRRGRQYVPLTDGTYFINRWFASIELIPKKVVPIGYVGVVVSYYGRAGRDVSGTAFRHGERVAEGERGVWQRPLGPGKYAFNTYAGSIVLVPTTNFVLHWITGKSETHRYDESLRSIDLVTKDAYEPLLPLSVVVHIDYERAPNVIQRFGDVKKLITQTLDPMLSAYFRDVAHRKTMLELLHERDVIQGEAKQSLLAKFHEFDIECVDVLIGKPTTQEAGGKIEQLLEQLRLRQLSMEQLETYERQRTAAEKLRLLNEAKAQADMQTNLTNTRVQVAIVESQAEAELARARKQAEQTIVAADADLAKSRRQAEQTVVLAEAGAKQRELIARGESQKVMQVGMAEVAVLLKRIAAYGDSRLYAANAMAEKLANSAQPLVPERVFVAGEQGGQNPNVAGGMLGLLASLLVADKAGILHGADSEELASLKKMADRMTADVSTSLELKPSEVKTTEMVS
jgi:uncharacterized membrane protein YqiK